MLPHVYLSQLPEKPLISIVVPSYNQGRYIKETIDSIVNQDYQPLEIIIIDGGSTDETVEILSSYNANENLIWISELDNGVVEAVNKGLRMAKGNIIGIQSSDDIYMPRTLSLIVSHFKADNHIGFVYGEAEYINAESKVIGRTNMGQYSLKALFSRDTFIIQGSAFFRREFIDSIGGWRAQYSYVADNDYWIRICLRTNVIKLDTILSQHRYHDTQRDKNRRSIIKDWKRMIMESEEIKMLPPQIQKSAKTGFYRTKLRYIKETAWMQRYISNLILLYYEPLLFKRIDYRDLIPAYRPIRYYLSKVKKTFQNILS